MSAILHLEKAKAKRSRYDFKSNFATSHLIYDMQASPNSTFLNEDQGLTLITHLIKVVLRPAQCNGNSTQQLQSDFMRLCLHVKASAERPKAPPELY